MSKPNWFQRGWQKFNAESDDRVYNIIKTKYYSMFQIGALYPNFNGFWVYFSIIQFSTYLFIVGYHWVFILLSIPTLLHINFVLFSQAVHYLVLATLTIAVLMYAFFRRPTLARFHKVINGGVYEYYEDDGEIFKNFDDEMRKEWKKLLILPIVVAIVVCIGLIFGPILDNYGTFNPDEVEEESISFEVPVPMFYPFKTKDPFVSNTISLLQLSAGGIIGITVSCGGLGYICLTQTVTREFRILLHAVEKLEDRASAMHLQRYGVKPPKTGRAMYQSRTFNQCLNDCFKKLYEHHLSIISLADDMTSILGFPNIIAFGGGPLFIGMALLSTTTSGGQLPGTTLTSLILCLIEISYMYLFSFLGQRVTDLSEDFRMKLYHFKWYYCPKNILVNLGILQVATIEPYVLYGPFKTMPSTLETFGSVMNSAYSFYNLMLAMD